MLRAGRWGHFRRSSHWSAMSVAPATAQPVFGSATRWALRLLAWTAFAVSSYLAWHAITETAVLGCDAGSASGCDEVLNSAWSKWLGIPVAVVGLACYATLAGLSVLIGVEEPKSSRWIKTAFVMLSLVAAVGSLWFIGVQVAAIGKLCPYCMVCDLCGVVLGGIAVWSAASWHFATRHLRFVQSSASGLAALRTALPVGAGNVGRPAANQSTAWCVSSGPSLPVAIGGGLLFPVLLIVGQVLAPSATHSEISGSLAQPLALDSTASAISPAPTSLETPNSQSHMALRISPDASVEIDSTASGAADDPGTSAANFNNGSDAAPQLAAPTSVASLPGVAESTKTATDVSQTGARGERIVKFLKGSLKLDVYKHPLLGRPDAPHVVVELLSYDCPHCRQMHRLVQKALARYGDQVAVIVLPVPMEMKCNKLLASHEASHVGACTIARMTLNVAAIQPSQFHQFHDWLMADKEHPPQQGQVIARAYSMVDRERIRKLPRSELEQQLTQYVELYARLRSQEGNSKFGLPVQILNDQIMSGMVAQESDLFDAWEKYLGVRAR